MNVQHQANIRAQKQNRIVRIKLEQLRRKHITRTRSMALSTLLQQILPPDAVSHIITYMSFKISVSPRNMDCYCWKCRRRPLKSN